VGKPSVFPMNTTIDDSTLPEFLRFVNTGTVETGDFARMWDQILSLENWQPGVNVLFDNRKLKVAGNGYELTTEAAKYFISKINVIGTGKIAVLMEKEENLQFGQQFNYQIGRTEQRVQYFLNESEAIGWVAQDQSV
jgi:hypothetical protein